MSNGDGSQDRCAVETPNDSSGRMNVGGESPKLEISQK